jgi:hypothetical protein
MGVKYTSFNLDKSGNQEELILNKVLSNQNLENKENKYQLNTFVDC